MATSLESWDQDGENKIFLPRKHVSKSLPKQDMQMFLNLPSYALRKVSKMSQQCRSRIMLQNIATLQQDSTIAEFCGRIQQRYSRTVLQQNSVAEHSNIKIEQYCEQSAMAEYCSRMLWQNTTIPQQSSMALHQNAIVEYHYNTIEFYNRKYPENSTIEGL